VKTTMLLALTACLMGCGSKDKGGSSKTAPTPATTSTTAATATATSVAVATATAASTVTAVAAATGTISLDLTGAVGLAMLKTGSGLDDFDLADGPALQKVNADGSLAPALHDPSEVPSRADHFFIAPNGKTYLTGAFTLPAKGAGLADVGCTLVEAAADGTLSCIDTTLTSVNMTDFKAPVQFDDAGGLYYAGAMGTTTVLRKYGTDSKVTDLLNSELSVYDFRVHGDGTVAIRGETVDTHSRWARVISSSGALKTITSAIAGETMAVFPDGKLYIGVSTPYPRIVSYDFTKSAIDAQPWSSVVSDVSITGADQQTFFQARGWDFSTYVAPVNALDESSVSHSAHIATHFVNTGKQEFAIVESGLYRYYPTCGAVALTMVKKITNLSAAGDFLVVSGTDANGANKLTLVDATAATPVETDLLPNDEVEIYHLSYSTKTKTLRFDGLRFSDNAPITGAIDLGNSNKAMLAPTGGVKLSDFQSL